MTSRSRGRPRHPDVLTPAEWRVLDWVRHGLSRRQVAERLGIGEDAVKYHLANIAGKLGVHGIHDLRTWPGFPATSRPGQSGGRKEQPMTTTGTGLGPIGQVSLSIRDVERATRFYSETLGLPHIFTFGDLAFFDAAGVRLYLHRKDEEDWRPGSIVYFVCDDIRAAHDRLSQRGVYFTGAPHLIFTDEETGIEEWMAFFEDGEGNTLALMSRLAPATG
jgi:DNA-binding CsgD family transcriptional regulator/predicted enzyme related to lactoylglutathione lyase